MGKMGHVPISRANHTSESSTARSDAREGAKPRRNPGDHSNAVAAKLLPKRCRDDKRLTFQRSHPSLALKLKPSSGRCPDPHGLVPCGERDWLATTGETNTTPPPRPTPSGGEVLFVGPRRLASESDSPHGTRPWGSCRDLTDAASGRRCGLDS